MLFSLLFLSVPPSPQMMRPRGGAGSDASQAPGHTLYSLMIVNKSGGLIYNKVKID